MLQVLNSIMDAVQVQVILSPSSIEVRMGMRTPVKGQLFADIKVEESTWYVQDSLLSIQLLKRNRRGHYANGSNNAGTFWTSVGSPDINAQLPNRDACCSRASQPFQQCLDVPTRLARTLQDETPPLRLHPYGWIKQM